MKDFFSACCKVTDNGVLSISTLPHLEFLIISQLLHVSDKFLGCFHHLKVLNCEHCPKMKDDGLCVLIERSSNLRILIINGCKLITENVFDTAVDVAESGFKRGILVISSNANFDIKPFNYATPLLRVVKHVAYQDSYRMDFKSPFFPVDDENYAYEVDYS